METKSGAASSRMEKTVSSYGAWLFEGNDGGFAAAAGDTLEIGENALRYTAGTAGRLDSPAGWIFRPVRCARSKYGSRAMLCRA